MISDKTTHSSLLIAAMDKAQKRLSFEPGFLEKKVILGQNVMEPSL